MSKYVHPISIITNEFTNILKKNIYEPNILVYSEDMIGEEDSSNYFNFIC